MQRRVSLPGADELFRATQDDHGSATSPPRPTAVPDPPDIGPGTGSGTGPAAGPDAGPDTGSDAGPDVGPDTWSDAGGPETGRDNRLLTGPDTGDGADLDRRSSGRVRHDEKMTVYVTSDELLDIEHARLALRRDHRVAVDRGRLVREAVSIVLADLADRGDDADLVRRLAPS